jgi:hypothetical protein
MFMEISYYGLLRFAQVEHQLVAVRVVPVVCEHEISDTNAMFVRYPRAADAQPLALPFLGANLGETAVFA